MQDDKLGFAGIVLLIIICFVSLGYNIKTSRKVSILTDEIKAIQGTLNTVQTQNAAVYMKIVNSDDDFKSTSLKQPKEAKK